ncbi:Methylamine utilization protein MauG [Gammaproteobacteria bacterium]
MKLPKVTTLSLFLAVPLAFAGSEKMEDLSIWKLPPAPIPADNPQTAAKIALGHRLAFDIRLSKNDSMSCAHCHVPAVGGGGPTPRAFGHGGELGRWAPTWVNSAYYTSLFWDGRASSLEEQTGALPGHMGPISAPGEMAGNVPEIVNKLNAIPAYKQAFQTAFGSGATPQTIAQAIASFERTLIADQSPFQEYVNGDTVAISDAAKRGFEIFRGKGVCTICHAPPALTDNKFHNIGVPAAGPLAEDLGRFDVIKKDSDRGAFKTPSLYNASSLAFFMHNGAFSRMSQVIAHYNQGGDPKNPNQSRLIFPLKLSDKEQEDLMAFLETLRDKRLDVLSAPADLP